jgi:RND family efflux transporter MFP subunit
MSLLRGGRAAGFLALSVILAAGGCDRSEANAPPAPPPPPVTVARPIEREVMEWDEYTGRLEAVETVEVRARVGGFIDSVSFKEGGTVTKGQPLFVIDPRPFQAELDRARGEVARAKAQLALAETEFKRAGQLVRTQAGSELELDEKRADRDAAKANLSVAQAAVTTAELNLGFTKVTAPIDGRISRIYVTAGNLITGGTQGGEATLLTVITSLNPMYCYVEADERSVLKYQRLSRERKRVSARDARIPARLALLNEPEFAHEGVIDFVDNRVDPTTGTLRARGVFPNDDGVMTPGLFGRVRIPGAAAYHAILVAESAIQNDQNAKYVMTVDDANVVHKTPITAGTAFGNMRAIESGLTGNERVIVNGMLRARPQAPVTPTEAPMPGEQDLAWFTPDGRPPTTGPTTTTAPTSRPPTQPVAAAIGMPGRDVSGLVVGARGAGVSPVSLQQETVNETLALRGARGGHSLKSGETLVCAKPQAAVAEAAESDHRSAIRNPESAIRNSDNLLPFGVPVASSDDGEVAE